MNVCSAKCQLVTVSEYQSTTVICECQASYGHGHDVAVERTRQEGMTQKQSETKYLNLCNQSKEVTILIVAASFVMVVKDGSLV